MMGLESLGPWESGRCVSLWPGVGSETMGARTGSPCRRDHYRAGGGSSRGEGMGERLRCQTPSTTSTPPNRGPLSKPKVCWPPVSALWKKTSRSRRALPTPILTPLPYRPSIRTTCSNRDEDRKLPEPWWQWGGESPHLRSIQWQDWKEMLKLQSGWSQVTKQGRAGRKTERETGIETERGRVPISLHYFNSTKSSSYYWQSPYWHLLTLCVCVHECVLAEDFSVSETHNSNKVCYVSKREYVYVDETT